MSVTFEEDGIRFAYPENWSLERSDEDEGWTVTLQGPGTAFVLLSYRTDMPTAEDMADTALEALREDYPELESEEHIDTLAGQMAFGHDVRFFSLDMTNTAWLRTIYSGGGTLLVLCQSTDAELATSEPVLRAICASLEVEGD